MPAAKCTIAVTGDVTVDWMFMHPAGPRTIDFSEIWGSGSACRAVAQAGAAALLGELLAVLVDSDKTVSKDWRVIRPKVPRRALVEPSYGGLTRTYMTWQPFPKTRGNGVEHAWRIAAFWGEDPAKGTPITFLQESASADVVVVDDSNLGFRDRPSAWPAIDENDRRPHDVVLKMAAPLGAGPLCERLTTKLGDVLTLVVPVSDLRMGGGQVGNPLSWEQTCRDVQVAVRGRAFCDAKRVVVLIGTCGAVVFEDGELLRLVFDPHHQEGDWEPGYPGMMMGYTTCMSAAIAAELAIAHPHPDVVLAVKRGLAAARALHSAGYQASARDGRLRFPFDVVVKELRSQPDEFADMHLSLGQSPASSILEASTGERELAEIALEAAIGGPESLPAGIPIETVGVWSSVDRGEIEKMRSVRNIMNEYVNEYRGGEKLKRPLSVVVFGPPGAGKSFAVKQIAKALLPGEIKTLEFNLSQFRSEEALPAAFHRVRDAVLEQYLPLVFWDEFDTPLLAQPLGWLRHFLAPMQDGAFLEDGEFHPLGPAIFVFAGGTSSTLQAFAADADDAASREAKKPDFLSRLRGYVNVLGPNQVDDADVDFPLRRALLLRALLGSKAPRLLRRVGGQKELNIDSGVLRAFIHVPRFLHGARSMESIIDMSSLSGKLRFERAMLPARHQLALHVDADAFLELVDGD